MGQVISTYATAELRERIGPNTSAKVKEVLEKAFPAEPEPEVRPDWSLEGFLEFYGGLKLSNGWPATLEGFQRLILRELFAQAKRGREAELLVLIPKGHAKTTLMAAIAVYHTLAVQNANVFIGAANRLQADEMYRFAAHFVRSAELEDRLKVKRGTKEITSLKDEGFIRVIASDDSKQGGKGQGFNPTLALVDELHAHENDNLYHDMRSGLFKNKGLLVTITTAGWDQDGALGTLRNSFFESPDVKRDLLALEDGKTRKAKAGRLTIARKPSGKSVMLEWAARSDDDLNDVKVVKLCNPASWVDIESIEDGMESLPPWTFARYRANRWTLGFESWLPEGAWEDLEEPNLAFGDGPVYAALDMARYRDCAALVAVQPREDAPAAVKAWIWRPGGPDDPVSYMEVKEGIRNLAESTNLIAFAYDPKYFDQSGQELADEGLPVELFPQSNERMCPAAADLRSAIINGELAHDGDELLARHLIAPIAKEVGENMFKLTKSRKNGPDIDAAEALAMAWALANVEHPAPGFIL